MGFPFGAMSIDRGVELTTSDVDETQVLPRESMFAATHCPFAFSNTLFATSPSTFARRRAIPGVKSWQFRSL
jgi:hypothetical protein